MTPEVSVVTPVWNRAHCIGDAIRSALTQDVSVECIVVDDGSTDDTVAVVQAMADVDPRVRLLEVDHGGPSPARNAGIGAAQGALVAFLDSDNLLAPGALPRLIAARDAAGADGVFGRSEVIPDDAVSPPAWSRPGPDAEPGWSFASLLVDRESLDAVGGFDPELRLGEDFDLLVRLREAGRVVLAVDEVVQHKRWFGDNLSYEIDEIGRTLGAVVRRHRDRNRPQ